MAKASSTTIKITRTHQVEQYCPMTIEVSNTYEKGLDLEGIEKETHRLASQLDETILTELKRARKSLKGSK